MALVPQNLIDQPNALIVVFLNDKVAQDGAVGRVDMTARLLSASFGDGSGPAEWVTTLRCCSAHEAFLRTYRRRVEPELVAECMLIFRVAGINDDLARDNIDGVTCHTGFHGFA